MKTETIKIEIPDGFRMDFDRKAGEIKIKKQDQNVMETINNVSDVLQDNGLSVLQFEEQCRGLSEDEVSYRVIKLLCKSLNQGWIPDWNNSKEYKYFPWFVMGSSGFRFDDFVAWPAGSSVGSRLCFKTAELAKYAGEKFENEYRKFLTIKP